MISNTDQKWISSNRRFLMASFRMVMEELESYKKNLDREKGQQTSIFTPTAALQDELKRAKQELNAPAALEKIITAFELSSFEKKVLLMCAGVELLGEFGSLISSIQGHEELVHPSFNLAITVFSDAHWSALSPAAPLRKQSLVHLKGGTLIAKSSLRIDEHILHYLTGFHTMNEALGSVLVPVTPPPELVPSQMQLVEHILKTYNFKNQSFGSPIIQLNGNENTDQMAVSAAISTKKNRKLFQLSARSIPGKQTDRAHLIRLWNREAALNRYALFVDGTTLEANDKNLQSSLIFFLKAIKGLILVSGGEWVARAGRPVLSFKVAKPTHEEQLQLWNLLLGKQALNYSEFLKSVVGHFDLSAKTLSAISEEVIRSQLRPIRKSKSYFDALQTSVWKTCCKYTRPKVEDLVQRIDPIAKWEDIVLPKTQKNTLQEIAMQVKNRQKVYNEWGFATKSSRGFGISVLFTGESGTGKTMAAEVLANELQLDLFRVDLSQVINKYIGETEKNLKRIFDAAEEGGCLLLFDEADALFGKRTEVKDSHDRYGNQEVSYLLQRMESYRGLAILTTNMKSALDTAFLRRIRFVCHFSRPDANLRAEIWKGIFPQATPLHKGLDIGKLSRLNVPGGNIRNIAMNAAFLAAAEDKSVQMDHILHAARSEYNKLEKTLTRNEIKDWQ